jgi:ribonuclease D
LASENACVIWRTIGNNRRNLPKIIREILADSSIVKVGQGIGSDVKYLREDFDDLQSPKSIQNLVDIYPIASRLNCSPKSLQGMVGILLRKRLLKEMRISNWEDEVLRAEQIQYAAIDAWASREVYLELIRRFDAASVMEYGRVRCEYEEGSNQIQHVEFRPDRVMITPKVTPPNTLPSSPQIQLVQICVAKGYLLRLCGFEKVDGGSKFKCTFEVTVVNGQKVIGTSLAAHASIREAQIDAASVTLNLLDKFIS